MITKIQQTYDIMKGQVVISAMKKIDAGQA